MSNNQKSINPEPMELVQSPPETSTPHSVTLKKKTPKSTLMALLGAILVITGTVVVYQIAQKSTTKLLQAKVQPIVVSTLMIQPTKVFDTIEFSGTIRSSEKAVLSTRVMGRITNLSLEEGDRVQKGQLIAQIDVLDIAAQGTQARSAVLQSQAERSRSEATLNQLQSQQLEAKAALDLAQINQGRNAQLYKEGAVSKALLDQANTAMDIAKARIAQAESGIRQAKAAIARSQAEVTQAKASVSASSANVSYGTILAPFDGVVTQKFSYEGETPTSGSPLLKLENPNQLKLEVSVPETNLRFVRLNQPTTVRIDSLNRTFSARVTQIVPAADPNSHSFIVKIQLEKSSNLIPGMFGRIELSGGMREAIAIPISVLLKRGQLEGVYVIGANNQTELTWVKTGKVRQGKVEIVSGLVKGDRIVTNNVERLSDGQQVTINN
ncbi:MAG: efflux RND transporter periplasmic adaptor subunit [Rhizonema sp. PD37]|nr:efflux RND transporter periplasmic adaptor subunit [Rhizonema sp. PD37]